MIKQIYICDVCGKEKDYLASRETCVMLDNFIIKRLGHVCEPCEIKLKRIISESIDKAIEELRGE